MLSLSPRRCIPACLDRDEENVRLNELKRTGYALTRIGGQAIFGTPFGSSSETQSA
jgi:hypothetical protein